MRSSKRPREDESETRPGFEHASNHANLESLLAEHLSGTGAAEAIVANLRPVAPDVTADVVIEPATAPAWSRPDATGDTHVIVLLKNGRELDGPLVSDGDTFTVAGETFSRDEIAELVDEA